MAGDPASAFPTCRCMVDLSFLELLWNHQMQEEIRVEIWAGACSNQTFDRQDYCCHRHVLARQTGLSMRQMLPQDAARCKPIESQKAVRGEAESGKCRGVCAADLCIGCAGEAEMEKQPQWHRICDLYTHLAQKAIGKRMSTSPMGIRYETWVAIQPSST